MRLSPGGMKTGGQPYSRGGLYKLLNNRLYVGEIEHKRSIYPGEHEGIVDREIWNQEQELLEQNRQGPTKGARAKSGSMLTGLLFSEGGMRYIPTNAQKGGRRYHYYTSQAVIKGNKNTLMGRLPAAALESAVVNRIHTFLQSPSEMLEALKQLDSEDVNYDKLLSQAKQRASEWARFTHTRGTFTHSSLRKRTSKGHCLFTEQRIQAVRP